MAFINPSPLPLTASHHSNTVSRSKRFVSTKACQQQPHSQTPARTAQRLQPIPSPSRTGLYGVDHDGVITDAEERLRGFVKVRASLDPQVETVYNFNGTVYSNIPGQHAKPLFKIQGFNVAVARRTDLGWRLLTREMAVYQDITTGEPLEHWKNVITGEDNHVVHVWNDPVNQELTTDPIRTPLKSHMVSSDMICWNVDVFPTYQSPLPLDMYPQVGGAKLYESGELFSFFVPMQHVVNASVPHVDSPVAMNWSRIGPWLPWMCMKDHPGQLIYHCQGTRLSGGIRDLHPNIRQFIIDCGQEKFFHAPKHFSKPNETSWSFMKKLIEQKGLPRADGRIASPAPSAPAVPNVGNGVKPSGLRMRREQLKAFKARKDSQTPIYMSVAGNVFDVSSAPQHYGFGETYACLTGIDASVRLLKGIIGRAGVDTANGEFDGDYESNQALLEQLSDDEKETLASWVAYFDSKYDQVGVLVDF